MEVYEEEGQASERNQIVLNDLRRHYASNHHCACDQGPDESSPGTKHSSPGFAGVIRLYQHQRHDYLTHSELRMYQNPVPAREFL